MSLFGTASVWAKIGLLLMLLSLILTVLGYATDYWMTEQTIRKKVQTSLGFWKFINCSNTVTACNPEAVPESYKTGAFLATFAFASMVLGIVAIVFLIYTLYVATEVTRKRGVVLIIIILGLIGGVCGFIMMTLWLATLPNNFFGGWSFGVSVFAVILLVIASLLLLHDMKKDEPKTKKNTVTPPLPLRTPSVPPFTPDWETRTEYATPKPPRKVQPKPPPSPIRVAESPVSTRSYVTSPTQVRVQSISQSSFYTTSSSPRRYGTPKYATRYDNRAR